MCFIRPSTTATYYIPPPHFPEKKGNTLFAHQHSKNALPVPVSNNTTHSFQIEHSFLDGKFHFLFSLWKDE